MNGLSKRKFLSLKEAVTTFLFLIFLASSYFCEICSDGSSGTPEKGGSTGHALCTKGKYLLLKSGEWIKSHFMDVNLPK